MSGGHELESLWRESGARLRAWFERATGSAADAEDLLQETFLRVHTRLPDLADAASVRAWLGTIARNVLHDHLRRRGRGPATERAEGEPPSPTSEDDVRELERTVAGWLEDFMAELAPADAEALRLVDLEGGTQRELAERQGLSLSGAKSRVQRARARLRARLEACCSFAQDARGGLLDARPRADGGCAPDCGR